MVSVLCECVNSGANFGEMELANSVGATAGAARTTRVMMEGVGARVIRGPDWKWGKQVRILPLFKGLMK